MNYRDSALEKWLRRNFMSTDEMVKLVGCSRLVIWKAKKGMTICPYYADKISQITKGEVLPDSRPVGKPKRISNV